MESCSDSTRRELRAPWATGWDHTAAANEAPSLSSRPAQRPRQRSAHCLAYRTPEMPVRLNATPSRLEDQTKGARIRCGRRGTAQRRRQGPQGKGGRRDYKGCPCLFPEDKWVSVSRSLVPNSLRPHGLQFTRLLCPWDFPGKGTGVGCHFLLQGIFPIQGSNPGLLHRRQILYQLSYKGSQAGLGVHTQSFSHAQLFAIPWTITHQAPLFPSISFLPSISCFRESSRPRDRTRASWFAGRFFPIWAISSALCVLWPSLACSCSAPISAAVVTRCSQCVSASSSFFCNLFIYFIFGCAGSSLLCAGFL